MLENSRYFLPILTEEDWKKFRQFSKKYIRVSLSGSKNMASMLGVSYDAIKKARQRLRKKINLPEEGGLEELAEVIYLLFSGHYLLQSNGSVNCA